MGHDAFPLDHIGKVRQLDKLDDAGVLVVDELGETTHPPSVPEPSPQPGRGESLDEVALEEEEDEWCLPLDFVARIRNGKYETLVDLWNNPS